MTDVESANKQIVLDIILSKYSKTICSDLDAGQLFEFFTAEQILKKYDFSYDEIESGLVGGSCDGGVDGMYLFIDGTLIREDTNYEDYKEGATIHLIIFQAKAHAGFTEEPVDRFIAISPDIFDLSERKMNENYFNKDVVDAIQRFRDCSTKLAEQFPKYKVSFFYSTKGTKLSESIKHKAFELKKRVESFIQNADIDFQFLGAFELCDLASKQKRMKGTLQMAKKPIVSDDCGYVGLVNLTDFFDFIVDNENMLENRLFEANVRDYHGNVEVNKAIQESLNDAKGDDFWWLNNGVTVLATRVFQNGKKLTIENPQIVNGLQTSKEIYNYCKKPSSDNDTRKVLVRVIIPSKENSRDNIIKATNSQTSVPPASLRSTDRVHRDIEVYLGKRGFFYDRRKNYYKNQNKPRNKIISIPRLAQAVMAIALRQPNQARARPSTLIKDPTNYDKIFTTAYPLELYYVCIKGMQEIESYLKSSSLGVDPRYRNDIRFYVAMHAIAGGGSKLPKIDKIAKFDLSCLNEEVVRSSLDFIMPKYRKLGGDARVSRSQALLKSVLNDD